MAKNIKFMVEETYVSFECAKLLKEKGFDEDCFAYYYNMPHKGNVITYSVDRPKNSDLNRLYCNMEFGSLPTQQMTIAWLRIVHKIYIYTLIREILGQYSGYDGFIIREIDGFLTKPIKLSGIKDNTSSEDVVEALIKYSLENLIK